MVNPWRFFWLSSAIKFHLFLSISCRRTWSRAFRAHSPEACNVMKNDHVFPVTTTLYFLLENEWMNGCCKSLYQQVVYIPRICCLRLQFIIKWRKNNEWRRGRRVNYSSYAIIVCMCVTVFSNTFNSMIYWITRTCHKYQNLAFLQNAEYLYTLYEML